jgi:hypothetical protein
MLPETGQLSPPLELWRQAQAKRVKKKDFSSSGYGLLFIGY